MKKKSAGQKKSNEEAAELSSRLEQVFLAGLGALSTATDAGEKAFNSLVDQGEKYHAKATKKSGELIGDVQGLIRGVTGGAQSTATGLFDQVRDNAGVDRLQSVFDERVSQTLRRIGVPSKADYDALNARLDEVLAVVAPKKKARKTKKAATKKKPTQRKATTKKRKISKKVAGK